MDKVSIYLNYWVKKIIDYVVIGLCSYWELIDI